jgi:hypothetical protein
LSKPTKEDDIATLVELIREIPGLLQQAPGSEDYWRWFGKAYLILQRRFGAESDYRTKFRSSKWSQESADIDPRETDISDAEATFEKIDQKRYTRCIGDARAVIELALEELKGWT